MSEWDPSIAALIAYWRERLTVMEREAWGVLTMPRADLDDIVHQLEALESAASALRGVRVTKDQEDQKPTRVDGA